MEELQVNYNKGFNGNQLTKEEVEKKNYKEKMRLIKIIDAKKEVDSGWILDYEECILHCNGNRDQGRLMLIDKHTTSYEEYFNKWHTNIEIGLDEDDIMYDKKEVI